MKRIILDGTWRMTGNGYDVFGKIPGSVYSFLCDDNNVLPNPFFRDNEYIFTEISEHEYTFEKSFDYTADNNSVFIVFEGLDTLCSVYLNDIKVADTDNMHIKYTFDITKLLKSKSNTLKVICHPVNPYIKEKNKETVLFGAYDCMQGYPHVRKAHSMMGWDWGPRLPDAGIWRSVYLLEKDSAEITDVELLQRHVGEKVFLTPIVKKDSDAEIEITLTSPDGKKAALIPNAENEIKDPMLWWPNGMGKQNLYEIIVYLKENGSIADERALKIGLRDMKLIRKKDEHGESFYHEINGIDMFAMGADYIPEDNIFSRITPDRTRTLLTHCRDCNFNAIRVWGGGYYPDDFFFDLCDELGLVVFFDLMFACSVYQPDEKMSRSIAVEVEQNLRRIRHRACLGLICGNNEIEWHFDEYVELSGRNDIEFLRNVYLELFEKTLPEIVHKIAPYISYIPSSPTSFASFTNDSNSEDCGDCHFWEDDHTLIRDKYFRYVSEFGSYSFPEMRTIESFTLPCDRNPNSRIMEIHQRNSSANEGIARKVYKNFLYPQSFEAYIYASQVAHAESVKYQVEHFRRNRGRCMGALYWQLNDIWPCISFSSIDYEGRYKALQYMAKRFYAPILISCEETGYVQTRKFINTEKGTFNDEKSARLCVTNDTQSDITGTVHWWLRDTESSVIKEGSKTLTVPARSAKQLDKLVFSGIDTCTQHLHFSFEKDGKTLSEGSVLFTPPKYHDFADPEITCSVNGNTITVKSNAYAKSVRLYSDSGDILLSDNFFDMEKGEKQITVLNGNANDIRAFSVYNVR